MLLKLQNIGKIYNSDDLLVVGIRSVNLEFDYNEFVTIEGESGSGKSTLLNVIGANDTYEEGELWFNGEETSHYSEDEWEKYRENNIATVFQDFNIIENLTVLENIELSLLRLEDRKERRKIALDLIEKVGLKKQAHQRGSKLSGGEKQRTVIARALAKDSPIILADEPTGNLDVKSSREIAKLLKEVSVNKLVIVVTHNPEFFEEYATRRIRVYDGKVTEDRVVSKKNDAGITERKQDRPLSRREKVKNTLHIGLLNYKSRPRFTLMMTFALFVCAITLFLVLSIFEKSVLQPISQTIDDHGIEGKVIVSRETNMNEADLDMLSHFTNARYSLLDRELSQFEIFIPRSEALKDEHRLVCVYDPMKYSLEKGEVVMVIPLSLRKDAEGIRNILLNANVGIEKVEISTTVSQSEIYLYLSSEDAIHQSKKIRYINSGIRFEETDSIVYSFAVNKDLPRGFVNIINSVYYDALHKNVVFEAKPDVGYLIADDKKKDDSGFLKVEMNPMDYEEMFRQKSQSRQACLYFADRQEAMAALDSLPKENTGILSESTLYVQDVGDVFTANLIYYLSLIAISVLLGMLIVVIFMRSVKIYESDFAIYKTLGISRKISSYSLYTEMAFIFLPTIVLLPFVSLISVLIPGSKMTFIGIGNYIFIEIMLFFIVEMVAFSFNKTIGRQSIRKSLKRGSK